MEVGRFQWVDWNWSRGEGEEGTGRWRQSVPASSVGGAGSCTPEDQRGLGVAVTG